MNTYEQYKDSGVEWIGEIPSHWEVKKLKYGVSLIVDKGQPSSSDVRISPENIESGTGRCLSLYSEYEGEGFEFHQGDVLLNKLRLYLKKIYLTTSDGYSMGEMIVLRPIGGLMNNKYLFNTLFHQGLIDLLDSQSNGVKLPRVSPDVIVNTDVMYPPLPEQHQIVSFLDEKTSLIDDLINKKEQKIGLLKEYRTSLINRVITKGLNPDCPMKDSGVDWIGMIPSHWDSTPLRTHSERNPHVISVEELKQSEVVHYSIPNVQTYGTGVVEDGNDLDSSKIHLSFGDIVLSKLNPRKSTLTIVSHDGDNIVGSGEFLVFRPQVNIVERRYLYYYLSNQMFTDYLNSSVESVTRSHQRVRPDVVYSTPLFCPPLPEQHQIVSFLDEKTGEIDRTIQSEQKKIELLKEYRQSLISSVITGKIKVVN